MEEHFVTYEQALALKELGFDEPCLGGWAKPGDWWWHPDSDITIDGPLKSQVFKWVRDEHKTQSLIQEYLLNTYMYTIDDDISSDISIVGFETYEEAESACIDKLIEIIKTK